jgi:hypothetical protein
MQGRFSARFNQSGGDSVRLFFSMTSTWTQETILRLAPDAASLKSGKDLSSARKWMSFNLGGSSIWGLCQGSGSKPYQTIVDLTEPAFKCSCPSRKFPCKHGLGLLLLYAADQTAFSVAQTPEWVSEWLGLRAERAKKKAEAAQQPAAPVDAKAQAQRRKERMGRIIDGLSSLRTWLDDLVRQGIATIPTRGYAFFDEPARRMIDAQAPGVARMVRDLATAAGSGADWQGRFLRQLASLHLLLRAAERLDELPPDTREDVMATIGVPIPQEEILAQPGISDTWQVIAQEVEFEDKLRVQRSWLFAVERRKPALVLHFAHGTGPLDASFLVGSEFSGELCAFPGNGVRAIVKARQESRNVTALAGYENLAELCDEYGRLLSLQPWLGPIVLPVRNLIPVHDQQRWRLVDAGGASLPARMSTAAAWRTMAASGGHAIDLAVRFDGELLEPLTVASDGQYVAVHSGPRGVTELAG